MSNGEENEDLEGVLESKRLELDAQKFEYQKQFDAKSFELQNQAETNNRQMQERQIRQTGRGTFWRFIGSGVISGAIAVTITMYGDKAQTEATARASAANQIAIEEAAYNRRGEILIQLLSAREAADSNLRARMFEALLKDYFQEKTDIARIAILEMIGLNFRDSVQVKPMFELLDRNLANNGDDREVLRDAAKTIIADQLKEIRHAQDGEVCSYELEEGESITPKCFAGLTVMVTEIAKDKGEIRVRVNSKDGKLLNPADINDGDEFSVSHFDMPMTDYTVVSGGGTASTRYSIVLEEIDPKAKKAKFAIAVLPIDSYSTQQEYKFDERLAEFLEPLQNAGEVDVDDDPNDVEIEGEADPNDVEVEAD